MDSSEDPLFNSRLSRVVSKLFARVVKAEESSPVPFSPASVDIEAIICFLEDALVACNKADEEDAAKDAVSGTTHLVKVLVTAILKARRDTTTLRDLMDQLEISPVSSALGKLVAICASELGLPDRSVSCQTASRDVSILVSAVAEAPMGPERDKAVAALREYKGINGDEDLNNHLKDVSAAFRSFILEQLSAVSQPGEHEKSSPSSMSERIKTLRSRLNTTEIVAKGVDYKSDDEASRAKVFSSDDANHPNKPTVASSASIRAFRERLAAAQEKRSSSNVAENNEVPESTTTAGSRAAALRARLQAVKKQAEQSDF